MIQMKSDENFSIFSFLFVIFHNYSLLTISYSLTCYCFPNIFLINSSASCCSFVLTSSSSNSITSKSSFDSKTFGQVCFFSTGLEFVISSEIFQAFLSFSIKLSTATLLLAVTNSFFPICFFITSDKVVVFPVPGGPWIKNISLFIDFFNAIF